MTTTPTSDDLYSLKWNDFYANILTTFKLLKENEDFVDVTIACEGGRSIKAHKLILSACSPFFYHILKDNPCSHPIIILKDITYNEMELILNFMYYGEIQILQENLTTFLNTAQSLQIKGLTDITNKKLKSQQTNNFLEIISEDHHHHHNNENADENENEDDKIEDTELDLTKKRIEYGSDASNDDSNNDNNKCSNNEQPSTSILIKALEKGKDDSSDNDMDDIENINEEYDMRYGALLNFQGLQRTFQQGTSLTNSPPDGNCVSRRTMELRVRATDPRPCPKCNKIYRSAHTLRTHLEDKHTICPGYRCVLCGTVAKSRNSLHSHMSRQHRGISTKDLPVLPMPAPFDPKLATKLLSKAGLKYSGENGGNGGNSGGEPSYHTNENPTSQQQQLKHDTTGSAILDTYLQFIAENSIAIGSIYKHAAPPPDEKRNDDEDF